MANREWNSGREKRVKRAVERSPQRKLWGKSGMERKPAKRAEEFRNSIFSGGLAVPKISEREGAARLSASEGERFFERLSPQSLS